ncbi:MAG: proteasome subunit alpha, partial [Chthoniobacteraceae bacterium]
MNSAFSMTTPAALAGTAPADFPAILRHHGLAPQAATQPPVTGHQSPVTPTQATTILAFKFADGVLVAGDRRATAGNTIMYDRADKVLEIDRHSLMAIAGVPATAWEMARVLEHSFHFFRRTQLAEMSLEGKVRALSKLLRDNLGFVLQGVGVVVPIFATFDAAAQIPRVYFYDPMGAQFEAADFAATGSGSPAVRAVLHYENSYARKPLRKLKGSEAVLLALRALDTAAESDSATGGVDRHARVFPIVKLITARGIETLPD